MRLGNAPVSWGVFEVEGLSADVTYPRVMDEIAAAGYRGTELGPWGFYPIEPAALRRDLDRRGLTLASAFVPVDLTDPRLHDRALADALKVAEVLQALGTTEVILADPMRPSRAPVAGRAGPADELSPEGWSALAAGLNRIGAALRERGMRAVFHHHGATYVETAAEIDRLLELTRPDLVGLCLDTGHAAYGGVDPVALLERWGDRVGYVHLKDVDPLVLQKVRQERLDYEAGVRAGVFCPLGQGMVDFRRVFEFLRRNGYAGWLIVEQDVIASPSGAVVGPSPLEAARQSRAFIQQFLE